MEEFDKKEIIRCRVCLRYNTCKRNKHNSSSCRLFEEDEVACAKYREKGVETKRKIMEDPITREFMEYSGLILKSINK